MTGSSKLLILTIGLPYSGKSTWAIGTGHPIVCPDEIRLALHGERFLPKAEPMVWVIVNVMVEALFNAGHDTVILDACNISEKRREPWAVFVARHGWSLAFEPIRVSADVCRERAVKAGDTRILPIINRMEGEWDFGATP